MSVARRLFGTGLSAIAGGLVVIGGLSAQTPDALRGRVVDADGGPVAGQPVALHRVTRTGGAAVGRATTDRAGEFSLELPADAGGVVLFVATRFDGRLYIGPTFRGGEGAPAEYRIVVGGPGIAERLGVAAPASGVGAAAETDGSRRWWIGGGAVLAAVLLLAIGRGVQSRPPERRRVLRDLALLEERRAGRGSVDGAADVAGASAAGDAADEDEAAYRRERAALRARLREIARA